MVISALVSLRPVLAKTACLMRLVSSTVGEEEGIMVGIDVGGKLTSGSLLGCLNRKYPTTIFAKMIKIAKRLKDPIFQWSMLVNRDNVFCITIVSFVAFDDFVFSISSRFGSVIGPTTIGVSAVDNSSSMSSKTVNPFSAGVRRS